jgi:cell wall-associated NlpC family hydrolase
VDKQYQQDITLSIGGINVKNQVLRVTAIFVSVVLLTSCAGVEGNRSFQNNQGSDSAVQSLSQNTEAIASIAYEGKQYIPVNALVNLLEFRHQEWDSNANRYSIGDIDVLYEVTANSRTAMKEGTPLLLANTPIMINGQLHMSITDITEMFQEEMNYAVTAAGLTLIPSPLESLEDGMGSLGKGGYDPLTFEDDPEDPFSGDEVDQTVMGNLDTTVVPASYTLKNINMNKLISTGKKYLGVKYKFGAGPYERTKRFDCSSYTQYVFGKLGVELPRNSRQQFRVGHKISRKNLRKGDLMFFYVPGRFRSNKIPGHVGIYMGNGLMIDALSEPKNGVQIRRINKAHWKNTYLGTRRVAQ